MSRGSEGSVFEGSVAEATVPKGSGSPDTVASSSDRNSIAGVFGVALGLLILIGLVAGLARPRLGAPDGGALLAEWFGVETLPFGLEVEGAVDVLGNSTMVHTRRSLDEPEAERAEPPENGQWPWIQWGELEEGPGGTPPVEVVFLRYARGTANAELERVLGRSGRKRHLHEIQKQGGRMVIDQGTIDWGPYAVRYQVEREFERGGTFVDSVRSSLTTPGFPCVMIARWARGFPADPSAVEQVLAVLEPN